MKKITGIFVLLSLFRIAGAQEFKCNVQVVSQQVQGTNKQVFETLQTAIYEFMNNKAWTNHVYGTEERIECNLMFNITEQLSADSVAPTDF
jgi:Flp pilus assembly protein TadG